MRPSEVDVRLCLVSKELAPFSEGGVGTYVAQACRAFATAGHEVHVLTLPHPGLERARELFPGVRVHVAECDEGPGRMGACRNEPMRHALAVYHSLQALHACHPFDFIEFPELGGEGAFALRAKRTLGALQSAVLAVRLHTPSAELRALNRLAGLDMDSACQEYQEEVSIREADVVLSPTHALLERVTRRLGLQRPGVVIPCPFIAETGSPHGGAPRERTGRARILFSGRLEYHQGLQVLIDAAVRLLEKQLDVEVRLIGADTSTGPFGRSMKQWLERRIPPAWRNRFHFEPPGPHGPPRSALREATVCCFPTLREDFPDECLRAMSEGAVVVGGTASGLGELLEDGRSGLLFPSGDALRLAEVLERALTDEPLRRTVREEAPQRLATCCAPERFVARTEELLARLASCREPRPPRPSPRKAPGQAPDVSILVPYYNMGRYLPETLRSLRAQTFEDYEILLVDDGSTDPASQRLVEELEGTPKLRIIRKPNGGLSSARNAGLREARGRWILPVDPDDLLAPTFLEKAVDVMSRSPGLGYTTALVSYFTEDPRQPIGGWVPWGMARDALCVENVASTCTALMERGLVEELGGYDEWLTSFEDWDVFCAMAERGYEGMVIPEFLFHYRLRPDSMTRTEATQSRHALIAHLLQKHPGLPADANRALRIQLGELRRQHERLHQALDKPLRYRLVDQVNEAVKQRIGFVHHALRLTAELGASSGGLTQRLQRLSERLGRGRRQGHGQGGPGRHRGPPD
ncbi:glycosyltransferase [Archangium sp.]|uniref:glycosyltransferase n=1 Tax=Archangium sp. TaxID=1872627 RepID=UPI00389A7C53